ncbi:MAG: Gfo/Idh/MocA family oxidoreductase [Clostridia bacterium]|nr:Gfo/Idh/MocA family oxidoreductase [Clostridia bacterium]
MELKPLKTIIVGGGHRSLTYANLANIESDKMKIVGVADPDENRRNSIAKLYNIPPERCFNTAEELAEAPKFADAVINGTMDHVHVKTTIPLLKAGYDVLLEKPFPLMKKKQGSLLKLQRNTAERLWFALFSAMHLFTEKSKI